MTFFFFFFTLILEGVVVCDGVDVLGVAVPLLAFACHFAVEDGDDCGGGDNKLGEAVPLVFAEGVADFFFFPPESLKALLGFAFRIISNGSL